METACKQPKAGPRRFGGFPVPSAPSAWTSVPGAYHFPTRLRSMVGEELA
jgi:hypothetical protein